MITEEQARDAAASIAAIELVDFDEDVRTLLNWAAQELARREAERSERAKHANCIGDALDAISKLASSMIRGDELPILDSDSSVPSKGLLVRLHRKQYEQGEQLRAAVESIKAALKGGAS